MRTNEEIILKVFGNNLDPLTVTIIKIVTEESQREALKAYRDAVLSNAFERNVATKDIIDIDLNQFINGGKK